MTQALDAEGLKRKLKAAGEETPEAWRTRLHRAISWLRRSEQEADDADARFIFLWIAFNAAYACEFPQEANERERLRRFFAALLAVDGDKQLGGLMLMQFSGPVRVLIENKYVFEPFWRALRDHDPSNRWEEKFISARKVAMVAVMGGDTATVLSVVFDRLYVLRNQLLHGGATWGSKINRNQVRDGATILGHTVPVVIDLMLDHPEADFGEIQFPVV